MISDEAGPSVSTVHVDEFSEWHDEHPEECPLCNPHVCDDYCQICEESR